MINLSNLPKNKRIPDVRVQSTEYMKIYKFLNPLHDINHESANSLLNNISMDGRHELNRDHPHFNHKQFPEVILHLTDKELYSLG